MTLTPRHAAWLKREGYKLVRIDSDELKFSCLAFYKDENPYSPQGGVRVEEVEPSDPSVYGLQIAGDVPAPDLNKLRYEFVRCLTPRQFADLYQENLSTCVPFDDLVDREIDKGLGV